MVGLVEVITDGFGVKLLKKEIKYAIKIFKLITLSFAIKQARMQEKAIEAALKKDKTDTRRIKAPVSSFIPKPSATVTLIGEL